MFTDYLFEVEMSWSKMLSLVLHCEPVFFKLADFIHLPPHTFSFLAASVDELTICDAHVYCLTSISKDYHAGAFSFARDWAL